MRCAYTGGALVALAREYGLSEPDIIVSGSGSAGFSLYYLTKQYDEIKKIATELLSTPKFISYTRISQMMSINYLIDTVFKVQQPLALKMLENTKSNYHILVKDVITKKTRYISKEDKLDTFEVLRATKSVPIFNGQKVLLGENYYADGSGYKSLEGMINKAIGLGAAKVLVVDCRTVKSKLCINENVNVFIVSNSAIPAFFLSRNSQKLKETYNMGYEDVVCNEDLKSWLTNN